MPTDLRVRKEAQSLSDQGIKVQVICYQATGNLNDFSYKISPQNYLSEDISGGGSSLSILSLLSFWIFTVRVLLQINLNNSNNRIHAHDFTALPPAVILKIFNLRAKLIYDAHELAPDAVGEIFPIYLKIIAYIIEIFGLLFADALIGVSKYHLYIMNKRYRWIIPPYYPVYNYPMEVELNQNKFDEVEELLQKHQLDKDKSIFVVYASYIVKNRGFDEIIRAFRTINNPKIILLLAGDGPYRAHLESKIKDMDNIKYLGYLHYTVYYTLLKYCDVGICLIDPYSNLNNLIGFPNKMTEYLATGTKILCTNLVSFQKEFNEGLAFPISSISNIEEIASGINSLVNRRKEKTTDTNPINGNYLWENNIEALMLAYS